MTQLIRMVAWTGMLLMFHYPVVADEASTIGMLDLAAVAQQADEKRLPILLLFLEDDCEDCTKIMEEFILPMQRSGEYTDKVLVRIVNIETDRVRDFTGKVIAMDSFVDRYNLELTPSVAIVNAQGDELAAVISGMGNVDFYASSLDEAIDLGLNSVRKEHEKFHH